MFLKKALMVGFVVLCFCSAAMARNAQIDVLAANNRTSQDYEFETNVQPNTINDQGFHFIVRPEGENVSATFYVKGRKDLFCKVIAEDWNCKHKLGCMWDGKLVAEGPLCDHSGQVMDHYSGHVKVPLK